MLVKATKFFFICLLAAAISLSTKAALAKTSQLALPMPFDTFTSVFLGSTTSPIPPAQSSTANTYIEVGKVILEYFKVLAWPAVVVYFTHSFKSEISGVLRSFHEADSLKINVLGQPVEVTKTQASATLKEVILEMKRIVNEITPEERKQLEKIMQAKSCRYFVEDIFPDFDRARGNTSHETLRKFRDAQFIRPEGGGQWQKGKRIEIKPFGQLMWDEVGSEKLFE